MSDESNGRTNGSTTGPTNGPTNGLAGGPDRERRKFLKDAALIGGAAGAATAVPGAVADTADDEPRQPAPAGARGYHVTPHIREYYQKARF